MSVDELGRNLHWLAVKADLVDDLLIPRQASSGENAGKPPARGKSKPPLVVGVADFIRDGENTLGFWCGQLVAVRPDLGPPPSSRRMAPRASWLGGFVPELEAMPWAEMMAGEVASLSSLVRDLVDPLPAASDPEPIEEGTTREIAGWLRHLGLATSRASLLRWVNSGALPSRRLDDGRVVVRLDDACELAKRQKFTGGPPQAVSYRSKEL